MKTRSILFAALSVLALGASACDKGQSGGSTAPSASGSAGAPPAAAKSGGTTLTLAKVENLKIDVPAEATAGDGIGSGAMITGPNLVVSVEIASASRPKTVDDARKDADMYTPKNLKAETLADGWALTYDNEGGMGKNYFAQVRREIGGKSVWCETTASTTEQQANALKACKSIKL